MKTLSNLSVSQILIGIISLLESAEKLKEKEGVEYFSTLNSEALSKADEICATLCASIQTLFLKANTAQGHPESLDPHFEEQLSVVEGYYNNVSNASPTTYLAYSSSMLPFFRTWEDEIRQKSLRATPPLTLTMRKRRGRRRLTIQL